MRELAGWALMWVVWGLPPLALLSVGAWVDDDVPPVVPLAFGVALLALPAVWLLSRRLREPSREEVAQADGRRPVLVLHGFARSQLPWYQRAFVLTPGFLRDLAEHLLERALDTSLVHAGPVLHLARPAPAPTHGPVALGQTRAAWEARLEEQLRGARLVAIVVDGTDENRHEIMRAAAICGTSRVIIVPPPRLDAAFLERWEAIRKELPALPYLDGRVAAIRFDGEARPSALSYPSTGLAGRRRLLANPDMLLRAHEQTPWPKPPTLSWFFTLLPIGFAVVGAVVIPPLMRELGNRIPSDGVGGFTVLLFVSAVILAVMSRRLMRLVPAGELPMVLIAALPWLGAELAGWSNAIGRTGGLDRWLRIASIGAAYAVPLLTATSLMLAGASLIRRSPGRSPVFAFFGLATLIPFVALYFSMYRTGLDFVLSMVALVPVALAIAAATVSASGDAGRRHAPLSIGSGVCAALAVGAIGCAFSHESWRDLVRRASSDPTYALDAERLASSLSDVVAMWPWFALAIPVVVVLVAAQFKGRASRVAGANSLSMLVLVAIVGLAVGADASAAVRFERARSYLGDGVFHAAGGEALAPGFEVPTVRGYGHVSPGPVDLLVDQGGAVAGGRRISTAVDLATTGGPATPRLTAVLGRRAQLGGPIRIGVDHRASADALGGAVDGAFAAGAGQVELVVRDEVGVPVAITLQRPAPRGRGQPARFLRIRPLDVVITDTYGTEITIPDAPAGGIGWRLGERLEEQRRAYPDIPALRLVPSPGLTVSRLLEAIVEARESHPLLMLQTRR